MPIIVNLDVVLAQRKMRLNDLAAAGKAVIVISSELPEILAVCDRIVTMREGRVTGEIARTEATQEILMSMMTAHEALADRRAAVN